VGVGGQRQWFLCTKGVEWWLLSTDPGIREWRERAKDMGMGLWGGDLHRKHMGWSSILCGEPLGVWGSIQCREVVGLAASCALEQAMPWREP
jgi:hypothetical protein